MPITKVWFSFSGRIPRRTWWLAIIVPYFGVTVLAGMIDGFFGTYSAGLGAGVFSVIAWLAMLWPLLAGHAKRCHDRGKTAWFILISFIPLIGGIWLLIDLGFLSGTTGDNRFGPDPRVSAAPRDGAVTASVRPPQAGLRTPDSSARTALPTQRLREGGGHPGISRAAYIQAQTPRD